MTVIGVPLSSPAKSRKGRIDWKTRSTLAADSALILIFRLTRSRGDNFDLNSKDLLPTVQPVTSASVASARHFMHETCCALSPGQRFSVSGLSCCYQMGRIAYHPLVYPLLNED